MHRRINKQKEYRDLLLPLSHDEKLQNRKRPELRLGTFDMIRIIVLQKARKVNMMKIKRRTSNIMKSWNEYSTARCGAERFTGETYSKGHYPTICNILQTSTVIVTTSVFNDSSHSIISVRHLLLNCTAYERMRIEHDCGTVDHTTKVAIYWAVDHPSSEQEVTTHKRRDHCVKFSWRPADPDQTGAEGEAIQLDIVPIGWNGAKASR